MAYYSESGGYCGAEEMRRPPYAAEPGCYHHGEGGERYAVRREYEEIDEAARAGRGHHHHHHHGQQYGHLGRSGSQQHHQHTGHGGHEGYLGEHREHGYGHGGRHYDACESRRYDSCTGQY